MHANMLKYYINRFYSKTSCVIKKVIKMYYNNKIILILSSVEN